MSFKGHDMDPRHYRFERSCPGFQPDDDGIDPDLIVWVCVIALAVIVAIMFRIGIIP